MVYRPTQESVELYNYTVNNGRFYNKYTEPLMKNLAKKYMKGTYDKEKAIDAYYALATESAKQYVKEYCTPGDNVFSVTDRFTVAVDMEKRYFEVITYKG